MISDQTLAEVAAVSQHNAEVAAGEDHIQLAARGCCFGPLAEWPVLKAGLERRGFAMPGWTPGLLVQVVCQLILGHEEQ